MIHIIEILDIYDYKNQCEKQSWITAFNIKKARIYYTVKTRRKIASVLHIRVVMTIIQECRLKILMPEY